MQVTANRYFLHMHRRPRIQAETAAPAGAVVRRSGVPSPEFSRFLYTAVGGDWFWIDRLGWPYARWRELLASPDFQTWVLYVRETPAGYFELHRTREGVEIASFGLIREFQGGGLGRYLLSRAIDSAWDFDTHRVWLHTCDLDHPHALDNYLKRGFEIFRQGECTYELPDQPVGPWGGALLPSHPQQRFA